MKVLFVGIAASLSNFSLLGLYEMLWMLYETRLNTPIHTHCKNYN